MTTKTIRKIPNFIILKNTETKLHIMEREEITTIEFSEVLWVINEESKIYCFKFQLKFYISTSILQGQSLKE